MSSVGPLDSRNPTRRRPEQLRERLEVSGAQIADTVEIVGQRRLIAATLRSNHAVRRGLDQEHNPQA